MLTFFPKGGKPITYQGGCKVADFAESLNEKSGTHHVVGGSLNSQVGVHGFL